MAVEMEEISIKIQKENQGGVKWEQGTGDSSQKADYKAGTGPCKPTKTIKPRFILNYPLLLQAHRDHMETYSIICIFMAI